MAGSFDAPGAMVSQTPQGVVAGAVVPPAVPQQANTFGAASPAAGAPSVILGVPQHLPPPPPPPPPAAFAAPAAGPHQAVPIQPNAPPHPPAYFGVQTPGAVAAPAAPQGMGLPPNPPPPVLYHQQQQPQQQQMVPPGMPGPAPGPGPGGQAGPPLGIEAGGGGPGFGHEGARDGWEGGGGRGIGGGRKERDGDRGRRMVKPIFCRYHNAKVQVRAELKEDSMLCYDIFFRQEVGRILTDGRDWLIKEHCVVPISPAVSPATSLPLLHRVRWCGEIQDAKSAGTIVEGSAPRPVAARGWEVELCGFAEQTCPFL